MAGGRRGPPLQAGDRRRQLLRGPVEDGERAVRALASSAPARGPGRTHPVRRPPRRHRRHRPPWLALYWKGTTLAGLSDDVIDAIAASRNAASSPRSYAAIFHMGGAVARVPHDATAYASRNVRHNMSIDSGGSPSRTTRQGIGDRVGPSIPRRPAAIQRRRLRELLDSDDGTSRVREAYGDDRYRRFAEVKAKYDPETCPQQQEHPTQAPAPDRSRHQLGSRPCANGPNAG